MKRQIFQKLDLPIFVAVLISILFSASAARAQEQKELPSENQATTASGGAFTLQKTVIAGGGSQSAQQPFGQNGTTGQTAAGVRSTGGNFAVYSGFWTPGNFTPTAAGVTIGGRVKTADGRGIRNVIVTVAFPSGERRTVLSGTFGYYRFAETPAGATYIYSVAAKRFSFSPPTQIRDITDDAEDIDFVADALTPPAPSEIPAQ